ncbi:hypothetical protein M758_1G033100 [Ceratodon purpureus]|nr:hypothetical protein M758_1G033100 [Ceratodon purpureus]
MLASLDKCAAAGAGCGLAVVSFAQLLHVCRLHSRFFPCHLQDTSCSRVHSWSCPGMESAFVVVSRNVAFLEEEIRFYCSLESFRAPGLMHCGFLQIKLRGEVIVVLISVLSRHCPVR